MFVDPSDGGREPRAGVVSDVVADLLMVAALFYAVAGISLRATDQLIARAFDDAFYFSRIAANVAHGAGSTFDGLHATNGYQPLWLWLLVPLYRLDGWSPELMFRFQLGVQVALLTVAALGYRRLVRTFVGGWPAAVGTVLFVFLVLHPSLNGMETAVQVLALLLLPLFAWRARALTGGPPRAAFGLGLLTGLAVLARLDLVFLPLVLGVAGVARVLARPGARRVHALDTLALLAGVALVMVPYLAWNRVGFGAWMPISGALKSSFPVVHVVSLPPERLGVRGMIHLACALAYLAAWALGLARRADDPARAFWRATLAVAAATLVLHLAYSTLFMDWAVFRWHFLWYGVFTSLVVPEGLAVAAAALRRAPAWRPAWSEAAGAALALVLTVAGVREVLAKDHAPLPYNWHRAAYDASVWARAHVPDGEVMAMHDAGLFGFFSGHRVVNLDGVVNDLAYQDALRDHRLARYLRESGVRYLVKHDFGDVDFGGSVDIHAYDRTPYRVLSHLHHAWSDTLWLERSREVYRSPEFRDQQRTVVLALWDLGAPDGAGPTATRRWP
jgi:hypothetical protein